MKEIKLVPDRPFHNSVDVTVIDFTGEGKERKRCKVTVEFAETDVKQLQNRGLDLHDAMRYYRDWLYKVVKVHISQDWQCVAGYEEIMDIIKEKITQYY